MKLSINQAELQFDSLKKLVRKINETKPKIFNSTILDDIKETKKYLDNFQMNFQHMSSVKI